MNNHQPFNTVGERGYLNLLQHILNNGYKSNKERTGTGTLVSPTPHQLHFPDVGEHFPLFTTKYVSFNMLACEMLWFISGSTNTNDLKEIGSPAMKKMWDKWADEDGELGPVYGNQARSWKAWYHVENEYFQSTDENYYRANYVEIDQLQNAIDMINNNPASRRIRVSHWNVGELDEMALPPCHFDYQFTCEPISTTQRLKLTDKVDKEEIDIKESFPSWGALCDHVGVPKYKLHLHLTQRSCDMFLGVPFNVAQYALLLQLVAQVTNTIPGGFTWTGINCHIYQNHIDAVKEQLSRDIKNPPRVIIQDEDPKINTIDDFTIDNLDLCKYHHHPKIQAEVSV